MDKLLGFVAPAIRGIVSPIIAVTDSITGSILGTAKSGVEEVAKLSEGHKKKSGLMVLVLGWLGLDPSAIKTVGAGLGKLSRWLMAF
jgi:hypothetical protein